VLANLDAEVVQGEWDGTTAHLRYVYAVEVTESGGVVPYRASVTLDFQLDGTFWVLARWFDEQGALDPETQNPRPTLGQRRGAFAASGGG
jgi:hypothetical protein